jgi:hypothetical protein
MLRTKKPGLLLVSAVLSLTVLLLMTACSIQKDKQGSNEKVKIETPVGALDVNTNVDAKDTGIAVYPAAKPAPKPQGDHSSANVNIASSLFGVKVVALEYVSDDAPAKVTDFYKKELAKYGNVLECKNGVHENGNELACSDKPRTNNNNNLELAVGNKQRRHVVSIKPEGTGTKFALVYVQVRSEEGAL